MDDKSGALPSDNDGTRDPGRTRAGAALPARRAAACTVVPGGRRPPALARLGEGVSVRAD